MYDVYVDDDMEIRAEIDEYTQVVLHMEVNTWNKRVYKKAKMLSAATLEALSLEGFETAYTITPNPKFVKSICGGDTLTTLTHGEVEHEVIIWELH